MPKMNQNIQRKLWFSSEERYLWPLIKQKMSQTWQKCKIMQTMVSRLSKGESRVSYGPANLCQCTWTLINPALNDRVAIPWSNRWNLTISLHVNFFFIQPKVKRICVWGYMLENIRVGRKDFFKCFSLSLFLFYTKNIWNTEAKCSQI